MIDVVSLTGGKFDPASRFRVRQHVKPLQSMGVDVHEYVPLINKYAGLPFSPKNVRVSPYAYPIFLIWQGMKLVTRFPGVLGSRQGDITWLQRDLLPGCLTLEYFLKKPLVFDVDDAIWLNPPFGRQSLIAIAKRADVIIAGNNYIAAWFEPYSRLVHVVSTAIDMERFRPEDPALDRGDKQFVIGWTGTASTLKYLESMEPCLRRFMIDHPDSEIIVIADMCPNLKTLPSGRFHYIPWSEDVEAVALKRVDVGIMPLPDNEWTRGKCSYKMLQYMACGIPVIVSPVGMNNELLAKGDFGLPARTESDWYETFSFFYKNRSAGKTFGQAGRIVAEKYFSQRIISRQLADIFKGLR